ncbi:uncharacterized protein [Pyrus communis]|uniref:uncharacterized protein isoform X1 n=1 Tax=Pyrus communis TaxID=23211 RepID=UPI0035BEF231
MSYLVTSLYGGLLEFTFIVQSTEDPAYRAVSMLLSELKDEVDVKIVVAGISTTCSQKIHNQLQKTLRRANWHNQFCQNCWRIPQPRSSSTARSMLRVETAIAPMLARAATPFQAKDILDDDDNGVQDYDSPRTTRTDMLSMPTRG